MGIRIIISVFIGSILSTCSPKVKKYEGTMFIVTKGRETVNLGGSTLYILKEQDLALHIEDAETWTKQVLPRLAEKARKEKARQQYAKMAATDQASIANQLFEKITSLQREFSQKKDELESKQIAELRQLESEARYVQDSYQYTSQVIIMRTKERYRSEREKLLEKYEKLINEAEAELKKANEKKLQKAVEARSAEREFENSSEVTRNFNFLFMEYVFSRLPRPFLVTRTDSEGKFKFEVPFSEKIALASRETRQVMAETETYFWYLHLPDSPTRPGDDFIYLDLTNSTSLESNYPGSVVRLPLAHFEVTD